MPDFRTSSEWEIELGVLILDPDGWDRTNIEESWSEFISETEFRRRAQTSTMSLDPDGTRWFDNAS